MPFILIRACLWLILSGAIIARAKIAKTVRKKPAAIMAVVLCTLLLTASAVFPVENLFVRFPSPESVSRYAIPGKIDDMVYGKDSCLVTCIGRDGTREIWFIPKTKSGYRIPGYFNTKRVSQKFDENGLFIVRRVRRSKRDTGFQREGRPGVTQLLPGEGLRLYLFLPGRFFQRNLPAY